MVRNRNKNDITLLGFSCAGGSVVVVGCANASTGCSDCRDQRLDHEDCCGCVCGSHNSKTGIGNDCSLAPAKVASLLRWRPCS
ncbi:Protein of unknown function [Pyronema omphalodes CBS 100304]|uniref:Uncharacterized protein n=1 Tax=Pyronema omphalodes (strain CBS 100304) TaxID=1076935 RepID=U4L279_PYROM|nr:Protein of unknown function [Pyronema omphalodes CBS 100304]